MLLEMEKIAVVISVDEVRAEGVDVTGRVLQTKRANGLVRAVYPVALECNSSSAHNGRVLIEVRNCI